jgi:Uma2 family endonuclease
MADNDLQFEWLTTIKGNLDDLFRDRPDVYVAGDHLIYAKEGFPKVRTAPDVYVAFGRPKGRRGSYKVWEEGGVFPQVVFEIRSPGSRAGELSRKLAFYDRYGAEEYYLYDPDRKRLTVYLRTDSTLEVAAHLAAPPAGEGGGWTSPRLGIRFDLTGPDLVIYRPDGERFLTRAELRDRIAAERQRAEAERQRAEAERQRAEAERQRAEAAERRATELLARLRALGGDSNGH